MTGQPNSKLAFLLTTLLATSNASISFPGSSFFSSGIFGSKTTESTPVEPVAAASSPAGTYTTVDFGTGTSNPQQPSQQLGGGQSGSGLSPNGGQQSSPSNGGSQPTYGGSSGSPQYGGQQGQQSSQPSPSRPQSSPALLSQYGGSQSASRDPQQSPPSYGGQSQLSPPSYGGQPQQTSASYGGQSQSLKSPPVFGGQSQNYGGQQSQSPPPSFGGSQFGGSSHQKGPSQINGYSSTKMPQSNSPGVYNPSFSPPVATYSSGVPHGYSGNSQPYLAQSSNVHQVNQYAPSGFITNAYDTAKLKGDHNYGSQPGNQYGNDGGFGGNGKNTSKKGVFSWTSPEGQVYEVSYVADALHSNSRPQGNFVGSPQQIPEVSPPSRTMTQEALNPFGIGGNTFEQLHNIAGGQRSPNYYTPPSLPSRKPSESNRFPIF